jgi:hypothetical protein
MTPTMFLYKPANKRVLRSENHAKNAAREANSVVATDEDVQLNMLGIWRKKVKMLYDYWIIVMKQGPLFKAPLLLLDELAKVTLPTQLKKYT